MTVSAGRRVMPGIIVVIAEFCIATGLRLAARRRRDPGSDIMRPPRARREALLGNHFVDGVRSSGRSI